jgi:hypothetical protein
MKFNFLFIAVFSFVITSCNFNNENITTVVNIDNLIKSIVDTAQVYDIVESPKYTRSNEQYDVIDYSQNDTTKLHVETFVSENKEYTRQLFYDKTKLVYSSEMGYNLTDTSEVPYIINTYFLGDGSQINYTNSNSFLAEGEDYVLSEVLVKIELVKPFNAVKQQGDFEMKFGEFLIMGPQSYLILSNETSKYDIALYIQKGDFLLDELYTNPEKYKGKTIFSNHEFISENGVTKMAYRGGMLMGK